MRDFSYKNAANQISDFSCKNQGREPGRQKKQIIEGSLEVKLPTIWTVEKQR